MTRRRRTSVEKSSSKSSASYKTSFSTSSQSFITSCLPAFYIKKHDLDTDNFGVQQFNLIFDAPREAKHSKNFFCNTEQ
uniref:Uncharacterized protein n=1 Tax=Rhizophora mucronata TaxID=61149 RepID=A0A2P2KHA5_RHIMU